jgi:hypothetical protein
MNDFRIYPEHKFIHTWTTGSDFETLMEFYKKVAAHKDFSKDYVGLVDMRRANLELTTGQAVMLAQFVVESDFSRSRWVLLVSEPFVTALSLVYQDVVIEQHELLVVSTLDAASEYLGLDLRSIIGA